MDKHYFRVIRDNIFNVKADAIVFGATSYALPTSGSLDYDVWNRAGFMNIREELNYIDYIEKGEIYICHPYALENMYKWLFNAVVPMYTGKTFSEEDQLADCYINSLKKADSLKLNSIAFALLGSGNMRFYEDLAFDIASEAIDKTAPDLRKMDIMIVINDYNFAERAERTATFTKEYVKQQLTKWRAEENLSDSKADEILQEGEEIRLYYDEIRMNNKKARESKEIHRQVLKEREEAMNNGKSEKQFSHDKIAEVIKDWLKKPNEDYTSSHYKLKHRSVKQLADMIGRDRTSLRKAIDENGECVPKRETLIALAVAMKLDKNERLRFILYRDPDKKYPLSLEERMLEELLNGYNSIPNYTKVNNDFYDLGCGDILLMQSCPKKKKENNKEK